MQPPAPSRLGLLLLLLLSPAHVGGLWWAVGSPLVMDPTSICRKARRLAGRQAELCQAEPEVVAELARGARLGVRECQFQFRFRRWNCSSHSKAFGRILQQDIRETAFVFAITAAGASHAVTQACSMGELLQCGCQAPRGRAPPRPPGLPGTPGPPGPAGSPDGSAAWEWGGCGDDVDFGDEKSRLFMDAQHKRGRGDIRMLVQLHNNEAGRLGESHPCCPFRFLPHSLALDPGIFTLHTVPHSPLFPLLYHSSSFPGCRAVISSFPLCALSLFYLAFFFFWSALCCLPFTTLLYLIFCRSSGPFCAPPPGSVPIRLLLCSPQAVRSHTRTECKCHGLSGSCALRTCWQKLPPFREVGARLLERFHGASRVMGTNDGKALLPAVRTLKPPGRADLLYAADSPDFCAPNRRTGSPGTRGRACNSSAPDLSGCDLLCCGRGHRQESVLLEENCLCRFHWCCVVQCHRCRVRKELSLCL
uniref:Protein Wnt n=1 Tax=Bos taurus TaxID=9913 RepID=F1MN70_BOVIN